MQIANDFQQLRIENRFRFKVIEFLKDHRIGHKAVPKTSDSGTPKPRFLRPLFSTTRFLFIHRVFGTPVFSVLPSLDSRSH